MRIEPTGGPLGARVQELDLAQPLGEADFGRLLRALGTHGVLHFPGQRIEAGQLRDLAARFGHIQTSVTGRFHRKDVPEVGILSNIVEDGAPIGIADAGQGWHTDMSYTATRGFVNVLYAVEVPRRDGRPLGDTLFADMHAAWLGLDAVTRDQIAGLTATHDFNQFWEMMRRRPGSARAPLTPAQRASRPPAVHPLVLRHPITGRPVLYCNPGYVERINELPESESEALLARLFAHQLKPEYQHAHHWAVGDVLLWDHLGTLHNALADYGADERRLMLRCQVMADRVFHPEFQSRWLENDAA